MNGILAAEMTDGREASMADWMGVEAVGEWIVMGGWAVVGSMCARFGSQPSTLTIAILH